MDKNKPTLAIYGIQDRINSPYPFNAHDHNLVLFQDGKIINFLHLERFTRIKNDNKLYKYIDKLLRNESIIAIKDVDVVFVDNIIGRAFISETGKIRLEAPLNKKLGNTYEHGQGWYFEKEIRPFAVNHELAHVYSCTPFYGKFKEDSLLVHFDGGASKSNFSAWVYKNNKISLIEYDWELKWLSGLFNANALTFGIINAKMKDQNSVPGKLMGLAGYGEYSTQMEQWLTENDFFKNIWAHKQPFINEVDKKWGFAFKDLNSNEPFFQDIVATIQYIFERELLNKIKGLQLKTNTKYLYYSGGSALNIKANTKLLNESIFKNIFIPPCANDSGLAIGAGALVELKKHGNIQLHNPFLNNWGISDHSTNFYQKDIEDVCTQLLLGRIIGICNGFGEAGPRALGNRSIIALASSKSLAHKVSTINKKREWYRPLAPVMLKKNLNYFVDEPAYSELSNFMLMEYKIKKNKINEIEGCVHIDGTSRIQTVDNKEQNPFIFDLLTFLDDNYNVKALINTSFNKKGNPIVHTIDDAYKEAYELQLDYVVVNGKIKNINP